MIQVQQLRYETAGRRLLQDVSFCALPGEVTVLLGANGAGKSTLLRLLAGELHATSGSIRLNGQLLSAYTPAQLALQRAVLTQHYAVALPFTCAEIVLMGRYPHFRHSPAALDQRIAAACMEALQVSHFANRLFNTLSGGEQQRVQLARVLAQLQGPQPGALEHKVLLLDEPTASMDYLQQQLCLQQVKEAARQGCTVLVVLHDLNLAAQFADKILLLRNGLLAGEGTPAEVLQPDMIRMTYGIAVNVLHHPDYDFPIIVPAPVQHDIPEQLIKKHVICQ